MKREFRQDGEFAPLSSDNSVTLRSDDSYRHNVGVARMVRRPASPCERRKPLALESRGLLAPPTLRLRSSVESADALQPFEKVAVVERFDRNLLAFRRRVDEAPVAEVDADVVPVPARIEEQQIAR